MYKRLSKKFKYTVALLTVCLLPFLMYFHGQSILFNVFYKLASIDSRAWYLIPAGENKNDITRELFTGSGRSRSDELLSLRVGDTCLEIKKRHITSRSAWSGGEVEAINLSLPIFDLLSGENIYSKDDRVWLLKEQEYVRGHIGWRSEKFVSVLKETSREIEAQRQHKNQRLEKVSPQGLLIQEFDSLGSRASKEWWISTNVDTPVIWMCHKPGAVPVPHCRVQVPISGNEIFNFSIKKIVFEKQPSLVDELYRFMHETIVQCKG